MSKTANRISIHDILEIEKHLQDMLKQGGHLPFIVYHVKKMREIFVRRGALLQKEDGTLIARGCPALMKSRRVLMDKKLAAVSEWDAPDRR